MIAVDSSIIVAIFLKEEDASYFVKRLEFGGGFVISSATYVELCTVLYNRKGKEVLQIIDDFMKKYKIKIEPLTEAQSKIATRAYADYPVLNFGDSFSYAIAKDNNTPLLFKGNDFSQTDIQKA